MYLIHHTFALEIPLQYFGESLENAEFRLGFFVGIGFAVVKVLFRIILRGEGKL